MVEKNSTSHNTLCWSDGKIKQFEICNSQKLDTFKITQNMRADLDEKKFTELLLQIGNGIYLHTNLENTDRNYRFAFPYNFNWYY